MFPAGREVKGENVKNKENRKRKKQKNKKKNGIFGHPTHRCFLCCCFCFPSVSSFIFQVAQKFKMFVQYTEKTNGFPFLDILRYLKNTHKNPKFGKMRQVPTREFPTKFPGWDLSHSSKFGIFLGIL